ncbi:MAG: hypothetical protein LBJ71_01870, partial [Holosporaceae bacterium]|nr:hypothetical protein [Holosporaceae bacterium]
MRLLETRLFSEENGKSLCKRQSGWFLRIFLPLLLCFFGISHEEIWAAKQKTTFSRERPPKP